MNAIFHHEAEAALEEIIQELAQHITWLRQQPNASENTVQQRARWLKTIVEYRASANATIQQAQNNKEDGVEAFTMDRKSTTYQVQTLVSKRFWDYEGTRTEFIHKAQQTWPELY